MAVTLSAGLIDVGGTLYGTTDTGGDAVLLHIFVRQLRDGL